MSGQPATTSEVADLDFGRALGALFRTYLQRASEAVEGVPGGPRGYQVLSTAAAGGCRNQAEIAESLGVDRTVMTYLLDDLEREGLIARQPDPADRRSRQIVLTAKGRRLRTTLARRVADVERDLLAGLGDDEASRLRDLVVRAASHAVGGSPGASCGEDAPVC